MIAATPDGRGIFITHPESGIITKLDARELGAPRIFTPGGTPFGIAVDPVGRFIYVGDWKKNVVRKLDAETGATLTETPVGREPAGLALDAAQRPALCREPREQLRQRHRHRIDARFQGNRSGRGSLRAYPRRDERTSVRR